MGEVERLQFTGAGGDTVYGWTIKPADFQPGKRYPVAFLIHGGPQGSFDNHFHYRWNLEVYAGASHQEMYLVFPIFWLAYIAVTRFVRTST